MIATDAAAIAIAVFTAQLLRFGDPVRAGAVSTADVAYGLIGISLMVVWLVALAATRSRLLRNTGTGMVEYQRVLQSTLLTFGAFAVVAYLFQLQPARGYLAIALPLGLVLLIVGRGVWRTYLHALRRAGRCMTGAIVVGEQDDVLRVVSQLRSHYRIGYRAIAVSTPGSPHAGPVE